MSYNVLVLISSCRYPSNYDKRGKKVLKNHGMR